ncbi:MAG: 50S ribosomal protein L4, partial [Planctomycetota bacterium]|nr:50S ribosomal protein L4 [Planctomycetota bacterium]
IFGPHPRDHSQKLPKKARRRALHDALLGKVRDSEVVAIDEFPLDVPKTRVMATLLTEIGVDGSCLIAMGPISEPPKGFDSAKAVLTAVVRMTRNLPGVTTTRIEDLNVGDVLRHRHLLVTRAGLEFLFPAKPVKAKPGKEE